MYSIWSQREFHHLVESLTFSKEALVFTCLQYKSFENTTENGEIACNEQFSPFPTVFSTLLGNCCYFH